MKLTCNKNAPLLGGVILAEYVNQEFPQQKIEVYFADENAFEGGAVSKINCERNSDVCRAIARTIDEKKLYGSTAEEKTEVDHFLTYSIGPLLNTKTNEFQGALDYLNKILGPITYLNAKHLTIADITVFATLYSCSRWQGMVSKKEAPIHLLRWYNFIKSQKFVQKVLTTLPADVKTSLTSSSSSSKVTSSSSDKKQEGKFVDLPGAEMGKVVVRFPPEASGYLHIGHAKAALLNQYYQQAFNGQLIMRFDDTNPAKENVHFEKVILEDVAMLEIKPDRFTHTSEYFDLMLEYCEKLLKEGKAYCDDTDPETMKNEREQKVESKNRSNSYEKNYKMWTEMVKGSEIGQKCCVRAKIDMQSPNGCMRDPTIYRCKNEIHPRTGDKYKVYPTYDFACPIVDAIEGVTHTLRTMEYHDRDAQFYWFIDALGLRKPYIWEYSRLSMTNTVLSKRKLTWFVAEGLVDGWDDPRFPTVRGVLRRGMTVEGLKQFIIAQGSSRSVVFMEWDKIWAFNKKVIDPIAPRYTALAKDIVTVNVRDVKEELRKVPRHPKNPEIGEKDTWLGPKIFIDSVDAETLKENENATFINWGNLLIKKINKDSKSGAITSIDAEPNLSNTDFKKTVKLTWLAQTEKAKFTPTYCVYFDHIISKALLGKDEDFKQFIGHQTRWDVEMLGDPELRKLKKGDIIQLQRRGFFKVDVAYAPATLNTNKEQPIVLFHIPDGHTKENPMGGMPKPNTNEANNKKNQAATTVSSSNGVENKNAVQVNDAIVKQGDLVRNLKAQKAAKGEIDGAVKTLLALKAEYKNLTGSEWKPGCVTESVPPPAASVCVGSQKTPKGVNEDILKQGNIVRDLKSQKANKSDIDAAVKILLSLKEEYKKLTASEWKPGCVPPETTPPSVAEVQSGGNKSPAEVNDAILKQGNIVRDLKSQKANKSDIDAAVKILLSLKEEYKKLTASEWKPGCVPPETKPPSVAEVQSGGNKSPAEINDAILKQGNIVRDLKSQKANKGDIDAAVKMLLSLKADYKAATGGDWKPGCVPPSAAPQSTMQAQTKEGGGNKSAKLINEEIIKQGDLVRNLKAQKSPKPEIDGAVKILLSLKDEYKKATGGVEWKPGCVPPQDNASSSAPSAASGDSSAENDLTKKITDQGNVVRDLKSKKAPNEQVQAAVAILLDLKAQFKKATGKDFPSPANAGRSSSKPQKEASPKPAKQDKKKVEPKQSADTSSDKKQTRLCLEAKKEENLSDWYSQVITKGEMIEYYDVSGCYILRPWSFAVWEAIKDWFDSEIKKLGVKNCYFPIFVSRSVLEKEKTHIADFAPEVAWVTKSGDSDMAEPIAVRPTSETVMYPAYAKWVQSYRDLPIKLNQWNNVVRWEFKHPQPFLRTREFLWQEGHTAFAGVKEAQEEVAQILDLYAKVYTDLLAIPVVKGRKTEKEKFAGGDYTFTVEAFVSASGRAIQGATSHHLGQNFSKMFEIVYDDPETQEKRYVYQNSWGITTRTIGVMIMVHADNQGLVIPPKVACVQVVIVPCGITAKLTENDRKKLQESCDSLEKELKQAGVKVEGDYRDNYSPGWKFNHWELKGVPIRLELGPKDIENNQFVAVRRDTGEKITCQRKIAVQEVNQLLNNIQSNLLKKATEDLESHKILLENWDEFTPNLDKKNIILAPFCGEIECEDRIKADSTRDEAEAEPGAPAMGAKSLCIPLEQPKSLSPNAKCIHPACKNKPKFYTLFGRSY